MLRRLTPGDLDTTLDSITRAAVEVLPQVQCARITMRHPGGTLDTHPPIDTVSAELDEQQYQLQEGPCYDTTTHNLYAVSDDLGAGNRYPHHGPVAVRAGIRSQAAIGLFENHRTAGGLNPYSQQVGALDHLQTMSRLFSHQAAVALAYSMAVTTLGEAVQSRNRIGQAVGIVMEQLQGPRVAGVRLLDPDVADQQRQDPPDSRTAHRGGRMPSGDAVVVGPLEGLTSFVVSVTKED